MIFHQFTITISDYILKPITCKVKENGFKCRSNAFVYKMYEIRDTNKT